MKLCPRCGGNHEGDVCPLAEVPRQEALDAVLAIERKITRARFRNVPVARWAGRGARYGFIAGLVLGLLLAVGMLVKAVPRPSWRLWEDFVFPLISAVLGTGLFGALLGAVSGIIALGVFRPIYIALFRSIDDWEQEYGDRRPRLPPRPPVPDAEFGERGA